MSVVNESVYSFENLFGMLRVPPLYALPLRPWGCKLMPGKSKDQQAAHGAPLQGTKQKEPAFDSINPYK